MLWTSDKSDKLENLATETLMRSWLERDRDGRFCFETWQKFFTHTEFPKLRFDSAESHNSSTIDLMSALYSISRGGLDLPFAASLAAQAAIAPEIIAKFGSSDQKTRLLPGIQSGYEVAAICNSEPGCGSNLKGMKSVCATDDDGVTKLTASKPLVTNAFEAKHLFVSAWEKRASSSTDPKLELFVIDSVGVKTENVALGLNGFRTGNCGALSIDELIVSPETSRLGPSGSGFAIFQHCFDCERLYLAVLVSGVLSGLEDRALKVIEGRPDLNDKQYVQEKLVSLVAVRTKIDALVHLVLSRGLNNLSQSQIELSLLKWLCSEDAPVAVTTIGDLNGWNSLVRADLFNKISRDFAALRFFGGTVELQKITIFSWMTREFRRKNLRAA